MSSKQSLDFLHQPVQPVDLNHPVQPVGGASAQQPEPADLLPQPVADRLMALPGVSGAWIERQPDGSRVVVLHVHTAGVPAGLPASVHGLPVRVQGHAGIDAQ